MFKVSPEPKGRPSLAGAALSREFVKAALIPLLHLLDTNLILPLLSLDLVVF